VIFFPLSPFILVSNTQSPGPQHLSPESPDSFIMSSLGRVMRQLASSRNLEAAEMISTDSLTSTPEEAPQVNLAVVDTQLNMHRFNTLFEEEMAVEGPKGWLQSHCIFSHTRHVLTVTQSLHRLSQFARASPNLGEPTPQQ
jgi:hypothetical protein